MKISLQTGIVFIVTCWGMSCIQHKSMLIANGTKLRIGISHVNVVRPLGFLIQVIATSLCVINVTDTNIEAQANEIEQPEHWKLWCAKNLHHRQSEALVANELQVLRY